MSTPMFECSEHLFKVRFKFFFFSGAIDRCVAPSFPWVSSKLCKCWKLYGEHARYNATRWALCFNPMYWWKKKKMNETFERYCDVFRGTSFITVQVSYRISPKFSFLSLTFSCFMYPRLPAFQFKTRFTAGYLQVDRYTFGTNRKYETSSLNLDELSNTFSLIYSSNMYVKEIKNLMK